jgi:hypothetical protein
MTRHHIQILFLIIFGLTFSKCTTAPQIKNDNYKLTIVLDTSFHYDIFDSAYVTQENKVFPNLSAYDTISKTTKYYLDSISSGNYVINIKTIFKDITRLPIFVQADTTIYLKHLFEPTSLINKAELQNADTIEFVYVSEGCFHFYFEKSILTHNGNDFILKTSSNIIQEGDKPINIQKKVPSTIIDSLFIFESDFIAQKEKIGINNLFFTSTTTQRFYLKIKNKVFQLNDQGLKDWTLYDDFKFKYITQTKK